MPYLILGVVRTRYILCLATQSAYTLKPGAPTLCSTLVFLDRTVCTAVSLLIDKYIPGTAFLQYFLHLEDPRAPYPVH